MRRNRGGFAAAFAVSLALTAPIADAQKSGGVLIMSHFDSPASMSMHEEATGAVNRPMMGVFNNLVMYRQDVAQNSMASIVPDLATGWSWNEEGTELTLPLRPGVGWHDGKPFTAKDVKCTWDLLTGRSAEKLRLNPRKTWYSNLEEVTANGEYEVTFRLKRPQQRCKQLLIWKQRSRRKAVAQNLSPILPSPIFDERAQARRAPSHFAIGGQRRFRYDQTGYRSKITLHLLKAVYLLSASTKGMS